MPEEIEINDDASAYYFSELRSKSWYVYDMDEWRRRTKETTSSQWGKGRYGGSNDVQGLGAQRSTGDRVNERDVSGLRGELEASVTPVLRSHLNTKS